MIEYFFFAVQERKRRDHIKDSFDTLRRRVDISNDKASRSSILQKAKERIAELETKVWGPLSIRHPTLQF